MTSSMTSMTFEFCKPSQFGTKSHAAISMLATAMQLIQPAFSLRSIPRDYSRQNFNESFRTESTTDEDYDLSSIWFGEMQYLLDASLPQLIESPSVENSDRQSSSNCIAIESRDSSADAQNNISSITAHANTSTDAEKTNISNLHADKIQSNHIKPISSKPFQMIWIARVLVNLDSHSASVIAPNEGASPLQSRFFKVLYFCASATSKTTSLCEADMISIPAVSKSIIRCASKPVPDGADRMPASSLALAQTLLSRLDLTLVSEGDVFLSNQAHIRNLHESSWLHTIQLESI
jgi:hypothetical protein